MAEDFVVFAVVGFLAQMVDGALGMAYGAVSASVLLALGVPPAHASASVHAAEIFTTAASGSSHVWHRNIDWRLVRLLAPAGTAGGVVGAYVLTGIDGDLIKPFITWKVANHPRSAGLSRLGSLGDHRRAIRCADARCLSS